MLVRAELLRVTRVAGGANFVAAFVSFTGLIAPFLCFKLFITWLDRFDFFAISSPSWNS